MQSLSPEVENLLSQGPHRLPLLQSQLKPAKAASSLSIRQASTLFPQALNPKAALTGLLLRMGCWDQSHTIAQDLDGVEGSYWHAIIHRMEPDPFNAEYWFRRVGSHPIFPALLQRSEEIIQQQAVISWKLKASWDPSLFIDWCQQANRAGGQLEAAAIEIQTAECLLLFNWCAGKAA